MPALEREQLVLEAEPRQESGPERRLESSKQGDWPVGHVLDHQGWRPYPGQLQLQQEEAYQQEVGRQLPAQRPVPLQLRQQ